MCLGWTAAEKVEAGARRPKKRKAVEKEEEEEEGPKNGNGEAAEPEKVRRL